MRYSDIFEGDILTTVCLGIWNDHTFGYCPYGKEGGPIEHYEVRFIKYNYEIPKEYWMKFYDGGYSCELGRKLRGRSHELTIYAIHKPVLDAKLKCWEALKKYLHDYTFSEHIRIRNEQGLNWTNDWYISVASDEAMRYIDSKIYEIKNEKWRISC